MSNLQLHHHPQVNTQETVLGHLCNVSCHVFESVNQENGDYVMTVSVDDIIGLDGQTILPATMPKDELHKLVRKLSHRITL